MEKVQKIVKTYKMEPETAQKLQAVAEAAGLSWDETFRALIGLYEQNQAGEKLSEHAAEIKDFRSHLNALQENYNHLLGCLDNAEERVREEFVARLATNEAAVASMQEKLKQAEAERDEAVAKMKQKEEDADAMLRTANETAQEDQEQITNLQMALESQRKVTADKEALIASQNETVARLKEQLQEVQGKWSQSEQEKQNFHEREQKLQERLQRAQAAEAEARKTAEARAQELEQLQRQAEFEKRSAVLEVQEAAQAKIEKLTNKYTHQLERALKAAQAGRESQPEESAEHKMEHEIGQTVLPDMDE